jgi:hypothetical protein
VVVAVVVSSVLLLSASPSASAATSPVLAGAVSDSSALAGATSVATSGKYAYTTAYSAGTLTAIDISDPAHPFVSGASPSATSLLNASTVNIAGGYAFVASKNRNAGTNSNDDGTGNSLTILDISTDPARPAIVGAVTDPISLFGAYGVAVSGNYAYVAAQGCLGGQPCPNPNVGNAFDVIDISSRPSPRIVATIDNSSLPAPWSGSDALLHACSVAVSGNDAFVTAPYSNRLTVIDISNPVSPRIVASLQDPSQLDFDVDVAVGNGYAYVADQASGLGRLAVVDVRDPTNPQVVGSVTDTTLLDGAYRVRVRGNFAYVAAVYASALAVVDVSDPNRPTLAGGYRGAPTVNRTTGLDLDPTGRYLVTSSPFLPTESGTVYPPYPFQPGGPTATGSISVIDLRPTPPMNEQLPAALVGDWTRSVTAKDWRRAGVSNEPSSHLLMHIGANDAVTVAKWRSARFSPLPGGRLTISGVAGCAGKAGVYGWKISGRSFTLTVVHDGCGLERGLFSGTWRRR